MTKGRSSAKKVEYDGYIFDSNHEFSYYLHLKELEGCGLVSDIEIHKRFELIPPFTTNNGDKIRPMRYEADFVFWDNNLGFTRVVDIKGFEEDHFKIKKKLFEWLYCDRDGEYSEYRNLEVIKYTKKYGFMPIKEYKKIKKG